VEAFADAEALADPEPEAVPELTAALEVEAEPVVEPEPELEVGAEWIAQPEPELEPVEAFADAEALEPEVLDEPVGEPMLAEVFLETDDAGFVKEAPTPDPSVACFAFTPTRRGYVLAPLDEIPSAGQTIYVPDVGERVVLRVGSYPLPLDERLCAFVEEPVTPPVEETPPVAGRAQFAERLARRPRPTLSL
jgi:hypothetical protein